MKKLLAILLVAMMVFALVACGDNNTTDPDKDTPGVSQSGENNNGGEENKDDVKYVMTFKETIKESTGGEFSNWSDIFSNLGDLEGLTEQFQNGGLEGLPIE